jgi:PAS domain S-box-containing protein
MTQSERHSVSSPAPSDVLQRVRDGVVVLDVRFRFTYVNPRAERILAHAHEDLLGRSLWSVFPDLEGTEMERLLRRAQVLACPLSFLHDAPGRDATFEVRVYPDADGLSVYFSDTGAEASMPGAQAFSEQTPRWFQTLVQNTSEAIYLKDCDGRYRFMNEAAADLFGLTPAEAVGKRDGDLFDAESAAAIQEADATLLRTGRPQESETVRFVGGEKHVFLTVKTPYEDETGAIMGILGMSRNITERIGREQALRTVTREYRAVLHNAEDLIFLVDVHHSETEPVFCFR